MKRRFDLGMTLIEVLIAVTLVSLLSVGMLFAIRAGLTAMDASSRRLGANRRSSTAQRVLEQQVAGFLPVLARCGSSPMGGGEALSPFFQGTPGVMRFVTRYSLQGASRGMPQIVELFVIPAAESQGVRLVVNEIPYTGPAGAGFLCAPGPDPETGAETPRFAPPRPSPQSFVLADKLRYCRFVYLESVEPEPERWLPLWRRADRWPRAIRIEMAPVEADLTRIPPMTFTGLIRPDRQPKEPYALY
ncbi:MAG: prepilin-type N-terminal cleavage/methylation domain-containing protein [Candidatus Solibacter usitatus]|nr:prepilin-type N-terminal cleavage/methylation domain-containing protein [Candidatus Solibacter usitatus]